MTITGLLLIVVAAAYVAAPFFAAQAAEDALAPATPGSDQRERLERQKFEAYAAIKEAEFDHQTGKLSEADFAALRGKYAAQAAEALAALDAADAARSKAIGKRPGRIAFCPMCGRAVPPRANFCPGCGRSLTEAVA